jgi:hypothetical protein
MKDTKKSKPIRRLKRFSAAFPQGEERQHLEALANHYEHQSDEEAIAEAIRATAEISGPVYRRCLYSGISAEELSEELEKAKHDMRAARRGA